MYQDIIGFWFSELKPEQWWQKDAELDALIERRFGALHAQASAGELFPWRETPSGSLAEVDFLKQPDSSF
ncbi:DUF924 family protein [Marinobacter sp. F4216]|uniref:DUF924 family protein n=1 Tax=Marinobacter sp. F4216 TaxID=2874281 RepID=UPI001CBCC882|nr:DUF924 family protein [Marinobacter sp. F4216]MBZ2169748.1 DUF924 domain-containing protein [Marinobacter sp. F4216]